MFDAIEPSLPDEITAVVARYAADARAHKIDLGIGIYRDRDGAEQLLDSIQTAGERIAQTSEPKGYLPIRGEDEFLAAYTNLMFRDGVDHLASVQAVGGTGAVRLACELVLRSQPSGRFFVGTPTWANHIAIPESLGLEVVRYEYYNVEQRFLNYPEILQAARTTKKGDVFVLHGPCHNPTGVDLSLDQRTEILKALAVCGAVPLFDVAYYGLGGGLDTDLASLQTQLKICPTALVAASCSKAFGLYQDRLGVLFVKCASSEIQARVQSTIEKLARLLTSSSPAHGALLAGQVLKDAVLEARWRVQLEEMRARIVSARVLLAEAMGGSSIVSPSLTEEAGLFTMLMLSPDQVSSLAVDHAIYLPASGRINLSGLTDEGCERLVRALKTLQD